MGKEGGRQRLRLPSPLSNLPLSSLSGVSGVSPSVSSQVNNRAVSLGSTKRHDDLPLDSQAHPGQVAQERHEVGHEMCLLMPRVYCLGSVGGEKEMELQREVYDVFICCVTPCIPYAVAVDAVDGVMSMSIPALMGTAEAAADEAAAADVLAHAALTRTRRHVVIFGHTTPTSPVFGHTLPAPLSHATTHTQTHTLETQLPWAGVCAAARVCGGGVEDATVLFRSTSASAI